MTAATPPDALSESEALAQATAQAVKAGHRLADLCVDKAVRTLREMYPTAELLIFGAYDESEQGGPAGGVENIRQVRDADSAVLYDRATEVGYHPDRTVRDDLDTAYYWHPFMYDEYEGDDVPMMDAKDYPHIVKVSEALARGAQVRAEMAAER